MESGRKTTAQIHTARYQKTYTHAGMAALQVQLEKGSVQEDGGHDT